MVVITTRESHFKTETAFAWINAASKLNVHFAEKTRASSTMREFTSEGMFGHDIHEQYNAKLALTHFVSTRRLPNHLLG